MLQPVMMMPSAVSSAAPTLNFEKSAIACSRARRAAPMSRSESLNDLLQQGDELSTDPACRVHDLVVIERLRQDTRGHVGDARDAEHLDAHVPGNDRLRDRRHADRVAANG